MSTTDVHRMIDNKLPEGSTCTAVKMYEVYTATIDGKDVVVSIEQGLTPEDIAIHVVSELGTTKNAHVEGADVPEEAPEEVEYDDSDDDDDDVGGGAKPKSKAHPKHKK